VEVLLTEDIPSLGISNEVVIVKDGYARNYLLPQGLAILATAAVKKERAKKIAKAMERKEERMSQAQELADRMARIHIDFERKSSEEGKLFGSVTKGDIVEELENTHLIKIDRKQIHLENPLKMIGENQIRIRLESGISANLVVMINPEGGAVKVPAAEETPQKDPSQAEEKNEEEATA
jgi:large subunit ribosomal protein L9